MKDIPDEITMAPLANLGVNGRKYETPKMLQYMYTYHAELFFASISKHKTDGKCYDQLGCNNKTNYCYEKVPFNSY